MKKNVRLSITRKKNQKKYTDHLSYRRGVEFTLTLAKKTFIRDLMRNTTLNSVGLTNVQFGIQHMVQEKIGARKTFCCLVFMM